MGNFGRTGGHEVANEREAALSGEWGQWGRLTRVHTHSTPKLRMGPGDRSAGVAMIRSLEGGGCGKVRFLDPHPLQPPLPHASKKPPHPAYSPERTGQPTQS